MNHIIIPTILFVGILFLFQNCNIDESRVKKLSAKDSTKIVEVATNVAITYTDLGKIRAKLFSPEVQSFKQTDNPYILMKKGIKGDFFDENNKLNSQLESRYALNFTQKKLVELKDCVHVMNIKNEHLYTEQLFWDQVSQTIYTDRFVKIVTPRQTLMGDGMTAKQDFTQWQIKSIRGIINN